MTVCHCAGTEQPVVSTGEGNEEKLTLVAWPEDMHHRCRNNSI